jgi:hypothetical protein
MQCVNQNQVLSREHCFNRWPDFPCYSRRDRACYDLAGTTQLFDPVSDMMYGVSNGYLMLFDFASRLMAGREVPSDPQTDQTIRETLHDYGMPLFGGPPATAIPESVRDYLPEIIRPVGPTTVRALQTNVPMIQIAENVGPGLRYTTIRDRINDVARILGQEEAPVMQRQISPDNQGEGNRRKRYRRKKRKTKRKKNKKRKKTRRQ